MAERSCAEIRVGGTIRPGQVRGLCRAIQQQGICTDWGGAPFAPCNAQDLLDACEGDNAGQLRLCDEEAQGGQFVLLEAYLQRARIPFDRRSDSSTVYDGELVEYRPGSPVCIMPTNGNGQPVVAIDPLDQVSALLAAACRPGTKQPDRWNLVRRARRLLEATLPRRVPRLPALKIAKPRQASRQSG